MKTRIAAIALGIGLAGFGGTTPTLTAMIQLRYNVMAKAVLDRDIPGLLGCVTADFVNIDPDGNKQNRKQYEAMMREQFSQKVTITSLTFKVLSVVAQSDGYHVKTTGVARAAGTNRQTKKKSVVEIIGNTDDIWIKTKSGWMMKRCKTTKQTMTVDGKPTKS